MVLENKLNKQETHVRFVVCGGVDWAVIAHKGTVYELYDAVDNVNGATAWNYRAVNV